MNIEILFLNLIYYPKLIVTQFFELKKLARAPHASRDNILTTQRRDDHETTGHAMAS